MIVRKIYFFFKCNTLFNQSVLLYLIHEAFIAHIIWYWRICSSYSRRKNTLILLRGPNWAKTYNLLQLQIFLYPKSKKFWYLCNRIAVYVHKKHIISVVTLYLPMICLMSMIFKCLSFMIRTLFIFGNKADNAI